MAWSGNWLATSPTKSNEPRSTARWTMSPAIVRKCASKLRTTAGVKPRLTRRRFRTCAAPSMVIMAGFPPSSDTVVWVARMVTPLPDKKRSGSRNIVDTSS